MYQRDMRSVGLRAGEEMDGVEWRRKIISDTDDPIRREKPGEKKKKVPI